MSGGGQLGSVMQAGMNQASGGQGVMGSNGVMSQMIQRPAQPVGTSMFGGTQPMSMFHAYRQGAPMSLMDAMNPRTPQQAQFLPQGLPQFDYAAYRAQQAAKAAGNAQAAAAAQAGRSYGDTDGTGMGAADVGVGPGDAGWGADLGADTGSAGGGGGDAGAK